MFCDWATNTIRSLDTFLPSSKSSSSYSSMTYHSNEILKLESFAVGLFEGTLLPSSVTCTLEERIEDEFLIVSRDGSIVQLPK